jgi:hypothetical protein
MIDLNDLQLLDEFSGVIDEVMEGADQEFFSVPAPVNDGPHQVTLTLGRDGIGLGRQKQEGDQDGQPTGQPFLKVHLEMRPIEGTHEGPGYVLFDRVNSIKFANAATSRLRAVLAKAGVPAPARCTLAELKAHTEAALASKPSVTVVTQWRASAKIDGKYVDVFKGQGNFPKDAQGKPRHTVNVKVAASAGGQSPSFVICDASDPEGMEIKAQATPVRYEQIS